MSPPPPNCLCAWREKCACCCARVVRQLLDFYLSPPTLEKARYVGTARSGQMRSHAANASQSCHRAKPARPRLFVIAVVVHRNERIERLR